MVALEDNLLILFYVLAACAAIALLGFALWKPVLRRAWRYLLIWWERDKIAERDAKNMRLLRERAEAEIAGESQFPISAETLTLSPPPTPTTTEPTPVYQRLKK